MKKTINWRLSSEELPESACLCLVAIQYEEPGAGYNAISVARYRPISQTWDYIDKVVDIPAEGFKAGGFPHYVYVSAWVPLHDIDAPFLSIDEIHMQIYGTTVKGEIGAE